MKLCSHSVMRSKAIGVDRQHGWSQFLLLMCVLIITTQTWAQAGIAKNVDNLYRFGPGDILQIDIFGQDELSGKYTLDGKGRFSMPLIGRVDAEGFTPPELEALLVSKLKPDYLVTPRVSVRVENLRPFYIIGEVAKPSSYAYVDGMTYLTAVAIAGGFTYRAKKGRAYVIRADDPKRKELKLGINEKVLPGDIIRIAERLF